MPCVDSRLVGYALVVGVCFGFLFSSGESAAGFVFFVGGILAESDVFAVLVVVFLVLLTLDVEICAYFEFDCLSFDFGADDVGVFAGLDVEFFFGGDLALSMGRVILVFFIGSFVVAAGDAAADGVAERPAASVLFALAILFVFGAFYLDVSLRREVDVFSLDCGGFEV